MTLAPGEAEGGRAGGPFPEANEVGVSVSLTLAEVPIDGLRHELGVWAPKAKPAIHRVARRRVLAARQALEGERGELHALQRDWAGQLPLLRSWLGRGAYDPEVIERDLRRVKAMNLNAVSVFVEHESLKAQHLLDLLRRCDALGLHVNQSLRPGTPMDFQWRKMKELIEFYRLAQNDTVFAYDLAWEPSHGGYAEQQTPTPGCGTNG